MSAVALGAGRKNRCTHFTDQLAQAQPLHHSLLCVGLDPESSKCPGAWRGQPDRTYDFCAAHRAEDQLERLMAHMRHLKPNVPVIQDAKRGDIGSTAEQDTHVAFTRYRADAVTLSPFMGFDTMEPLLCLLGKTVELTEWG